MSTIRTDSGYARYQAAEWETIFYTLDPVKKPRMLWFHGNNQGPITDYTGYFPSMSLLAQDYYLFAADFGGNTFGNDTGIARVTTAETYLGAKGYNDPMTLFAMSAGCPVALNYAVRNPTKVKALALVIPVLDFTVTGPGQAQLDAAYPPAYDDNNSTHNSHNPIRFAGDLPVDLPIHLFVSGNDPSVPPATADAFKVARPQTELTVFGNYGHGGVDVAVPLVSAWLKSLS